VILEHMNDAYAKPGASAEFECRVMGEPLPHISWYVPCRYLPQRRTQDAFTANIIIIIIIIFIIMLFTLVGLRPTQPSIPLGKVNG